MPYNELRVYFHLWILGLFKIIVIYVNYNQSIFRDNKNSSNIINTRFNIT